MQMHRSVERQKPHLWKEPARRLLTKMFRLANGRCTTGDCRTCPLEVHNNGIGQWRFEPGLDFSAGGHIRLACRRIWFSSYRLGRQEASRPTRPPRQENFSPRAVVLGVHQQDAKVIVDAAQHTFQDPSRLIPMYAVLGHIRLSSSPTHIESAERLVKVVLNAYSEPNLTPEEFHSRAGRGDDPLREFSNVCRRDLESLWAGLQAE